MKAAFFGLALTVAISAQATQSTTNTNTVAAAAPSVTGTTPVNNTTSTSTAETKPAASNPWSGSLVIDARTNAADKAGEVQRLGDNDISTTNYIGAKYKLNAKDSIAVQQYFLYNLKGTESASSQEGISLGRQRVVYSKGGYKLGSSEEFAIPVRYYLPTTVEFNSKNSLGKVNLPIEVPFTITPKLSVSWLAYPMASFYRSAEDNTVGMANYAYAYYSLSDRVQPYMGLGHTLVGKNWNSLQRSMETADVEFGMNFNLPNKIFIATFVAQSTNLRGEVNRYALLRPSETQYAVIGSLGF